MAKKKNRKGKVLKLKLNGQPDKRSGHVYTETCKCGKCLNVRRALQKKKGPPEPIKKVSTPPVISTEVKETASLFKIEAYSTEDLTTEFFRRQGLGEIPKEATESIPIIEATPDQVGKEFTRLVLAGTLDPETYTALLPEILVDQFEQAMEKVKDSTELKEALFKKIAEELPENQFIISLTDDTLDTMTANTAFLIKKGFTPKDGRNKFFDSIANTAIMHYCNVINK